MNVLESQITGQGRDLVLLHGWGLNSGVWQPWVETLRHDFRVHCVDLPGFGQNYSVLPEIYSLSALTDMVADKVPRSSIIVGWSLGGLVAQQLALSYRDKVAQLIGVATSPCFLAQPDWPGIDADILDGFRHQLHGDIAATIDRFLAIQAMGSSSTRQDIARIKQAISDYPDASPVALDAGLTILRQADLRQSLTQIQCPTLRIYGRRDSLVPMKVLGQVEQLQPQTRSMLFPKASHAPFISHQQEFEQAIARYLSEPLAN
ncbi:Pimeloyl-[acyl-carrier protein] methyl ester esterase [Saliniradius amylolyticus]|uniref:Pimeloyl-[acyl-carrier protein] methyl ester esterase n=1 Tax=Saliniradius amylolyticus TaxID=2183582 RepID=A0A2S2DYZ3_9ALTE|nr:pimeloyl-ACP methyl ester esterase BioH [Saliniradius amylolyticus]AWL10596.1 Pimeloyl-[acyl-carrier protein] methyl ester esterase [Saliniradius amylolyticus]